MATVTFNTNAATGDGSFKDVYTNASSGDTISPDFTVFDKGDLITITPTSSITADKNIEVDGDGARIRFQGGSTARFFLGGAYTSKWTDCELIGFSGGSGGVMVVSNGRFEFTRCLVAGNSVSSGCTLQGNNASTIIFYDCAIYGNGGGSGGVQAGSTTSVSFYGSTIIGNIPRDVHIASTNVTRFFFNSILNVASNVSSSHLFSTIKDAPSEIGFISPPPDTIDTFSSTAWQNWNLHLLSTSAAIGEQDDDYITEYDLDGNHRKSGGDCGAYNYIDADYFFNGTNWSESQFSGYSSSITPTANSKCHVIGSGDIEIPAVRVDDLTVAGWVALTLTEFYASHGSVGVHSTVSVGSGSVYGVDSADSSKVTYSSAAGIVVSETVSSDTYTVPEGYTVYFETVNQSFDTVTNNGTLIISGITFTADLIEGGKVTIEEEASVAVGEISDFTRLIIEESGATFDTVEIGSSATMTVEDSYLEVTESLTNGNSLQLQNCDANIKGYVGENGSTCVITGEATITYESLPESAGFVFAENDESENVLRLFPSSIYNSIVGSVFSDLTEPGYLVIPKYDASQYSINPPAGITLCGYNASVTAFNAYAKSSTRANLVWKTSSYQPILLQYRDDEEAWHTLTMIANPVDVTSNLETLYYPTGTEYRLFDGENFITDYAFYVATEAIFQARVQPSQPYVRNENVAVFAQIYDAQNDYYLQRSDVASITATLYRVERSAMSVTNRSAVAPWNSINIDVNSVLALTKTTQWTLDNVGFNFLWISDQTGRPASGLPFIAEAGSYELQFKINLTDYRKPVVVAATFEVK